LATVNYTKDGETINVMVTPVEGKEGVVSVIVSKGQ
jgi:hypothetical protein